MIQKLTYTQRSIALLAAFLLFLLLGYRWSFSDTFDLAEAIAEKEKKLSWLKDKEKEIPTLQAKMLEFERAYAGADSGSVRDKLTAFISDYAEEHHCLVTEIPLNTQFTNDRLRVQTNSFTLKGSFTDLLKLVDQLEKEYKYVARIMSARFFSIKDPQTKKKALYLTLIAQSFKQQEKK